jgi:hypothetical protein
VDFDQAITAHSQWKTKLSNYLSHRDGTLKAADAGSDNKCVLGKWIHGEGAQYSSLAEFSKLKAEHAHFHKEVAEIIRKADSGKPFQADVEVGPKSEFGRASTATIIAIAALRKRVLKA